MNLIFDATLAERYKSPSQITRVLTESWVKKEVFCPNCEASLSKYPNNKPVGDFYCGQCTEDYELKSKKDKIGKKIVDGAYKTMMERLLSADHPNLFFLNYDLEHGEVLNFMVIPKQFFVPELIEKRPPLSLTARRAGWVGCNILLQNIPQSGKIFYVQNKKSQSRAEILKKWKKTLFLREFKEDTSKGWTLDIMKCIDYLGKPTFSLQEIYKFETILSQKHPKNHHVKDKIRQQLQLLRDKKYLEFLEQGIYRLK